jgi:hypothetical protein
MTRRLGGWALGAICASVLCSAMKQNGQTKSV